MKSTRLTWTLAWWLSAIALPIVALQGKRLRKTVPRLPEATGVDHGIVAGSSAPLTITSLGESTVAGVGVVTHSQGFACRLAEQIGAMSGRETAWRALGMNGAAMKEIRETLTPRVAKNQDVVVVLVGVNDTVRLTSTAAWQKEITLLIETLKARGTRHILFSALPPLHVFPALPQPTRTVLGIRSRLLDRLLQEVVLGADDVDYVQIRFPTAPDYMAIDGFHPSALGYEQWATQIAEPISGHLSGKRAMSP